MYSPCASSGPIDKTPGVTSDLSFHFGVGLGPDCQFGTADDAPDYLDRVLVPFTPAAWGVARDGDVPDGAPVGHISTSVTAGFLNNGCATHFSLAADLMDATVQTQNTVDAHDPGPPFRRLTLDTDQNGVPDGADHWPSFLTALAQKNGWDLSKLRSRAFGYDSTSLPGSIAVFNLLTFEPGSPIDPGLSPDPRLGYPTLAILGDPAATSSSQDFVSVSCSPLVIDWTLSATAYGVPYRTNPGDGKYYFVTYSQAQPDADDDGIENALDPCPFTPDPSWDPRAPVIQGAAGDSDADGLPASCDPNPNVPSAYTANGVPHSDEDGDGWINRADNCPLVANPDQLDSDGDGIGDACDPHPQTVDGLQPSFCNTTEVAIGAGGGLPAWPYYLVPCAGGVDQTCSPTSVGVLAILRELAGNYPHTICFPQVDANCNGQLDVGDALYVLLGEIHLAIIRPCDFYAPPM